MPPGFKSQPHRFYEQSVSSKCNKLGFEPRKSQSAQCSIDSIDDVVSR